MPAEAAPAIERSAARVRGYAMVDEVFAPGMATMAAPVFRRKEVIGVISIAGPRSRLRRSARGSGVLSTRYGKIEDLLLSLRVATPADGLIETVGVPRHAVGPEFTQLFVGSEGSLGIIVEATLVLHMSPLAERRAARAAAPVPADAAD